MATRLVLILTMIVVFSMKSIGQLAPVLGTTVDFVLFTAAGDYTNTGATTILGNTGTDAGTYDGGFSSVVQTGTRYVPNPVTALAATGAWAAFNDFDKNACASIQTGVTLGNGETITPGQYCYGDATPLEGTLNLNGGGDPNSMFIFRIGGAFSLADFSKINLENGASWSNVYWRVDGAFNLGSEAVFAGTVVASGAINLLDKSTLQGRVITTAGAVNLHGNILTLTNNPLPVTLVSFTATKAEPTTVILKWETTAETNSDYFQVERSAKGENWKNLATLTAQRESNGLVSYSYTDLQPLSGTNLYRLKMVDRDGTFTYSRMRTVELGNGVTVTIGYPNPTVDKLTIAGEDLSQIERLQLSDMFGRYVYDYKKQPLIDAPSVVDMQSFPSGLYIMKITRPKDEVVYLKVVKQ